MSAAAVNAMQHTDPASGLIPDQLEADINQLVAVLKEPVR